MKRGKEGEKKTDGQTLAARAVYTPSKKDEQLSEPQKETGTKG